MIKATYLAAAAACLLPISAFAQGTNTASDDMTAHNGNVSSPATPKSEAPANPSPTVGGSFTQMMADKHAAGAIGSASDQRTQSSENEIKQALSALPRELRGGATVITYTAKGDPVNLRWGNNIIFCIPNQPGSQNFSVSCFGPAMKAERDMEAKERAEGKDPQAIQADVQAARASHKLPGPAIGATIYIRSGKSEADAHELWVVQMPNEKADELGLPTEKGNGTPWMMHSGTLQAHLIIPQSGSMDTAGPDTPRVL